MCPFWIFKMRVEAYGLYSGQNMKLRMGMSDKWGVFIRPAQISPEFARITFPKLTGNTLWSYVKGQIIKVAYYSIQ